jgi:excisionase family DNA binding protein
MSFEAACLQEVQSVEPLWEPEEVATYLKVSRSWVYHAAQRGELPCLRYSRHLRFEPEEIRAWARKQRAQPATLMSMSTGR